MSTECEACAGLPDGARSEGYGQGWVAAMRLAHHAHEDDLYLGRMSANGVLGSGPDDVIVDGDWLAQLEERSRRPLARLDRRIAERQRALRYLLTVTIPWAWGWLVCRVTGRHVLGRDLYDMDGRTLTWCSRCGKMDFKEES